MHTFAYPTWGNITLPDCTFASAADWELIAAGHMASESEVIADFYEAGGTETGLKLAQLSDYWMNHGISGMHEYLEVESTLEVLPAIASITDHAGDQIGEHPIEAEGHHVLLVTGTNGTGPEVVTWGDKDQITWAEWESWKPIITRVVEAQ